MHDGLILFAHGARDPRWADPFRLIEQHIAASRPGLQLRLAFLELMGPSLAEAAAELCAAGCSRIAVQPMFLGTGGHLRRDLPLLMEELRAQHPDVQWLLQGAIGEAPAVIDAMAREACRALDRAS